ncbi:MAG: cell division protein FtsA [Synergistaceae bacterium]|nr:cell division protein FtsA [Synergistaceae bacterium]
MPGRSDNLIVGLSLGTTKTTMIVAEKNPNYPDSVHVIGFGYAPSKGIAKGIIVNLPDARQSVMRAFQEAQSITGIPAKRLNNVIVAFNALDVQSESTHGMITLGGRESKTVGEEALQNVIDRARDYVPMRSNMYSLHMIPTRYELDGQNVDDPLDMNGSQLDVWLQTVAFPMTYVQNVVSCVRGAGIDEIRGLVLKPLASSLGAVYEEEMRAGCISICIGGGTTGIVLYRGGRAFRVMSIPIGGEHVSRDLATVMHMTLREAELTKKRMFSDSEDELRRDGIDVDLAYQVIFARLEELFDEYIRNALAECTPQHFPGGIILSGGVSDTPGIDMMLEDILQMPVRKVKNPIYAMPPGLDNAAYVSAAGILKYYVATEKDPYLFLKSDQSLPGLAGRSDDMRKTRRQADEEPEEEEEIREEPEYEEEEYEEDEEPRENIREMLGGFMDKIKKLF